MGEHGEAGTQARTDSLIHLFVGEWRGRGIGDFPSIERVEYTEELTVAWDSGREVLCYDQRAVLADGTPSHREVGFIRLLDGEELEMWNAQSGGRTEVLQGRCEWNDSADELVIDVHSVAFGNDARMLKARRQLRVSSDRLRYEVFMSTTTVPESDLLPHLTAELARLK